MKQNHRYIDLSYDDEDITNPLRLRIPVQLDKTFLHWGLLTEGTKFYLNKSRVWNQTKSITGPVTLSLNNAKVYYLEKPNDFSQKNDYITKWLNLTDDSSDDSVAEVSKTSEEE